MYTSFILALLVLCGKLVIQTILALLLLPMDAVIRPNDYFGVEVIFWMTYLEISPLYIGRPRLHFLFDNERLEYLLAKEELRSKAWDLVHVDNHRFVQNEFTSCLITLRGYSYDNEALCTYLSCCNDSLGGCADCVETH